MGEIFRSFIAGREAGEDRRQRQTQRTALEEAGQLYGLGKTDAAENSLVAAGMPEVAANYSALGEARRARQGRDRATQAAQALGPDATPGARTSAMADAYLEFGDPEQARALQEYSNSIDDRQRQNDLQRLGFVGSIQANLQQVPMEQRLARARELVAQSPYANDPHMQALADDDTTDLSDDALIAGARATMSAEGILAERTRVSERAEDVDWRERVHRDEVGLRREALNAGRRPENLTPLQVSNARASFASASGLLESYNNFVEMLRNARPQALAGIGPEGAALQSARTLLSIQAKSPAALDLGALVGADFTLLGNTVGDDNWTTLVRQGGKDGALRRLEPFGQFLEQGRGRLRTQYEPWAHQMPDVFASDSIIPPETERDDGVPAPPNAGSEQGGITPEQARAELERRRAALPPSRGTAVREGQRRSGYRGGTEIYRNGQWVRE